MKKSVFSRLFIFIILATMLLSACGSAATQQTGATPAPAVTEPPTTAATEGSVGVVTEPATSAVTEPAVTITPAMPTSTPSLNAILAEVLRNLPEGRMAFNPPSQMRQGEGERVELRIMPVSTNVGATAVQATLTTGLEGSGEVQVEPLKVGTVMRAKLSGTGFEITPLSEEEQIVADDTFTQWAWNVAAVKSGEQELNLLIAVRVTAGELGERGRDLPVITKNVRVSVDPVYSIKTFVDSNWQWLATTLLIPFIGWGYKVYSGKRAAKAKEHQREV